jgi:hypothetical protein
LAPAPGSTEAIVRVSNAKKSRARMRAHLVDLLRLFFARHGAGTHSMAVL